MKEANLEATAMARKVANLPVSSLLSRANRDAWLAARSLCRALSTVDAAARPSVEAALIALTPVIIAEIDVNSEVAEPWRCRR